jgi:deoxyadenosine/deoxycytidine kinase
MDVKYQLRLISAQPATDYYAWQTEVYLHNFLSLGYNGNQIDVVCAVDKLIPDSWLKLREAFPYVRFFFYRDEDPSRIYSPAVQAHILKKHFEKHPELSEEAIFFHDCDMVFTRWFDFTPYLNDDNWYFSNVDHYIGADYLESKGVHKELKRDDGSDVYLMEMMCRVVGVCACKIRANRGRSGGAQKLMKNVKAEYWAEVEEDSINLYNWLLNNKDQYGEETINDIQIWTASMWSELWNAWKRGANVMTPSEFDFCWATCHESKWGKMPFMHNAGVINNRFGMFYKAEYVDKLPYNTDLKLDNDRCSYHYYSLVQEVGKKSVLL